MIGWKWPRLEDIAISWKGLSSYLQWVWSFNVYCHIPAQISFLCSIKVLRFEAFLHHNYFFPSATSRAEGFTLWGRGNVINGLHSFSCLLELWCITFGNVWESRDFPYYFMAQKEIIQPKLASSQAFAAVPCSLCPRAPQLTLFHILINSSLLLGVSGRNTCWHRHNLHTHIQAATKVSIEPRSLELWGSSTNTCTTVLFYFFLRCNFIYWLTYFHSQIDNYTEWFIYSDLYSFLKKWNKPFPGHFTNKCWHQSTLGDIIVKMNKSLADDQSFH